MSDYRRRLMMASYGAPVPPSYDAEVEYLQATGTQYINTGIYPDNTYTFDTKIAKTVSGNTVYWGVRNSGTYTSNNQQCYFNENSSGNQVTRQFHLYSTNVNDPYAGNWSSGVTPVIGTAYSFTGITVVATMNTMTYPLTLFAFNVIGSINASVGACRIYSWKAYSSGNLVASFKPVRIGSVGYMYDEVRGRYFGNNGSGSFTVGPDL